MINQFIFTANILEVLSSDEDDIDKSGAEYLETLQSSIRAKDFPNLTASLKYDEDDSDDEDYEPNEETELETYTTPLDVETCEIDEYVVFKEVFQSKLRISHGFHSH